MTQLNKNDPTAFLLKLISHQPIQFARILARGLAGIVNLLKVSKTSKTLRLNLEIALPDLSVQQREIVVQQAIRNELTSYFEFFSIWGSDNNKNIARIAHVQGMDKLQTALSSGHGCVLIAPHFGTWEIMNAYLAQFTDMTIMYKPVKNEAANQFVRAARSREKATLVPTDESGVRQIFKALKQGGTTVILPDHTPNQGGEMIPFFGIPLASSNLSAKLIQKTKAHCLLIYALRNAEGLFDMHIEEIDSRIYNGTANEGTRILHESIEQLIRRYPEHYHWSYKRFKAHPDLGGLYNLPKEQALAKIQSIREQNITS